MTEAYDPSFPDAFDIAVIIPAFNSGGCLDQALASVAGQTILPAAVMVADDCSTDDTADRARHWQDRLPIEVIRLDSNHGPAGARHRAIQATSARFLAMLDSDDLFLPDHLETMAATHAACPGLVSAQELSWYPGRGLEVPAAPPPVPKAAEQMGALLRRNFVNFGFFSHDLYERAGGFQAPFCEDWDLWIRMVRAGATVAIASHPTAVHRVHPGSRSSDLARQAHRAIAVLTGVEQAAHSRAEVTAARIGLRTYRGRACFYRATELVAEGHSWQARLAALKGLPGGGPRAAAGLLALAVAPGAAVRLEQRTRLRRRPTYAHMSPDGRTAVQPVGGNRAAPAHRKLNRL